MADLENFKDQITQQIADISQHILEQNKINRNYYDQLFVQHRKRIDKLEDRIKGLEKTIEKQNIGILIMLCLWILLFFFR